MEVVLDAGPGTEIGDGETFTMLARARNEPGLQVSNIDDAAQILDVQATVPASDWLPRKLVFYGDSGAVLAELNAENLQIDQGIDPETIRALPEDAEVIDNRGQ